MSPIAIVGIAVELPSGAYSSENLDHQGFFDFLLNSGESYEPIPQDRFNASALRGKALGQVLPSHGSFLKNLDMFDHTEFGVASKDARAMPVGTRKLLELSFLALRDAGVEYRGQDVGCFMAAVQHDLFMLSEQDEAEAQGSFATGPAMVANRVSYHLDLRGPSVPVDTACSSTLTATHLAIQSLNSGDCTSAVVGGAQINHRFTEWLQYSVGGIASADGKCKPFDASADGFGRAEAAAVIVLKPLEQALEDGDRIRGVILGTGINSSGSIAPVNAPVASAQENAMRRAFQMAGRSPQDVSFLELHATGTARGDPTEANWAGKAFQRDGDLLIGSVKGNIGHSEITAFFASLSKVLSIMETGLIPPNVNLKTKNPAIKWDEYHVKVVERITRLPKASEPLVAMTSSGIGGANGHAVIEGPPPFHSITAAESFWRPGAKERADLLVLGGLSPRSTTSIAQVAQSLIGSSHLRDATLTYGRVSRSMTWRSWGIARRDQKTDFSEPILASRSKRPIVFVFSGQGSQHFEMGRGLYRTCRVFQEAVEALDAVYLRETGESLVTTYGLFDAKTPAKALVDIWPIAITLPAITMLQLALFDTLVHLGIKPDYVIGHSAGETAVMYASGAASREMAMELAIARGRGMSPMETQDGTMAAFACTAERAQDLISAVESQGVVGTLQVGCFNTPDAVTLSGMSAAIDKVVELAKADGIFATRLRTKVPVHCDMMSKCEKEYRGLVSAVFAKHAVSATSTSAYSSLSGDQYTDIFTADYFWDNTIGPVRFSQAMENLVAKIGDALYVEIGPHPVLASYISSLVAPGNLTLAPLRRPGKIASRDTNIELTSLLSSVGQLASSGFNSINYAALAGCGAKPLETLPRYPFSARQWPIWVPSATVSRYQQPRNGPLNFPQLRVNTQTHPSLAQHSIKGEPIMPATGYIEMALEFGARQLWNVEFISIIGLSANKPTPVDVRLDGQAWTVRTASIDGAAQWPIQYDRLHARGFLSKDLDNVERSPAVISIDQLKQSFELVKVSDFYKGLRYFADYGPEYRRIKTVFSSTDLTEFLIEVRGMESDLIGAPPYRIHPAVFDAAIHAAVHPMFSANFDTNMYFLPSKFGRVILHDEIVEKPIPDTVYSHMTLTGWTPDSRTYQATIYNKYGVALCTMVDLEVERHGHLAIPPVTERYTLGYQPTELKIIRNPVVDEQPSLNKNQGAIVVLPFVHGNEMAIQKELLAHSHSDPLVLWLTATKEEHGPAAIGFSRSLRREFLGWQVHLTLFDSAWLLEQHEELILGQILSMNVETETFVDADGTICVPRVTHAVAPSIDHSFNEDQPWSMKKRELIQHDYPPTRKAHILVDIDVISSGEGDLRAYIGVVRNSERLVMGIMSGEVTNVISAPERAVVDLPASFKGLTDGPPLLAAVTIAIGLDVRALEVPLYTSKEVVIVTHSDTAIGFSIVALLKGVGYKIHPVPSTVSRHELAELRKLDAAFVFSGYTDRATLSMLEASSHEGSNSVFSWNNDCTGVLKTLQSRPWVIGNTLRSVLPLLESGDYPREKFSKPIDIVKATFADSQLMSKNECKLFNSEKTYLLVGGIGSLGCLIALWMYQNGARRITMTSRSGRRSVFGRQDPAPQQALLYLESRSDLKLSLFAADAADETAMRSVVSSIDGLIGGCMLLCLVLSDKSFVRHTEATYSSSFPPKVGAFETVEKILSIPALDWLIACSSGTVLFGNAGQTGYTTANSIVDGQMHNYPNAFALLVPAITDSGMGLDEYSIRLRHLLPWAFTTSELCLIVEDGIRKLRDGPFDNYIPAFKWDIVQEYMGLSPLYAHLVTAAAIQHGEADNAASPAAIVRKQLDISVDDFSIEVPLTAYGLDSLSAARLSHALRSVAPVTQMQLLADMTFKDILAKIAGTEDSELPQATTTADSTATPSIPSTAASEELMQELLDRYSARFSHVSRTIQSGGVVDDGASGMVVFITGTTGAVGCAALAQLARSPDVAKIYALNRSSRAGGSIEQRQRTAVEVQGWDMREAEWKKVQLLEGDFHRNQLGLDGDVYKEVIASTTHIIHSAYPVNFNMSLTAFEPSIAGVENMLILALSSQRKVLPRFVFVSSFAALLNVDHTTMAQENPVLDARVSVGNGYSESKYVCENIVLRAMQAVPELQTTILRPGQISGAPNGAWDINHWVSAIVVSGPVVKCLPMLEGTASWIPVSEVADVLSTVVRAPETPAIVHVVRPNPVPWATLIQHAADSCAVPVVPWDNWLDALERSMSDNSLSVRDQRRAEPAIRLRSLFHNRTHVFTGRAPGEYEAFALPNMDTAVLRKLMPALETVPSIGKKDVESWMGYWRSLDML